MDVKDLRIGSVIFAEGRPVIVDFITPVSVGYGNGNFAPISSLLAFFQPITLTEEILLKCGSKELKKGFHRFDRFNLKWMEAYKYWYVTDIVTTSYITKVEFLHEWQNVVFVLNGEELTVNL